MTDKRIKDLYEQIYSGHYDLLSLDIFDTVVWRKVPRPTDVFFLLAGELGDQGYLWDSATPESFVRERINAEKRARDKKPFSNEVTLEEIYHEFPAGYLKNLSIPVLQEREIALEKKIIRPHPDIPALIDFAKSRGLRTAFVSDTYFTSEMMNELVTIRVDYLILSSEHRVPKYLGLHWILLEKSGVSPDRILHAGDNFEADIKGPKIFNIHRYWFHRLPESFEKMFDRELSQTLAKRARYMSRDDDGLSFIRSYAANACQSDYETWGSLILGPVLAGFAQWVINRCRALEIQTVLCLMREGRILKKTMDTFQPEFDTYEFYISRYTVLRASIFDADPEEIAGFIVRPSIQKAGKILIQLGLEKSDYQVDPETPLIGDAQYQFINGILEKPALRKKIISKSRAARQNLLRHLSKFVQVNKKQRIVLIDLGYSATIQGALQRILYREKIPIQTHGFYVVTGGNVYKTQKKGANAEGWLAENGQPLSMAHSIMRSPEILEQSMMAECGTTIGHQPDGTPILDDIFVPKKQLGQIREIQVGAYRYCRLFSDYTSSDSKRRIQPQKSMYQQILIRSVINPLPVELDMFGGWEHDENFGSSNARNLIDSNLDPWKLSHMSAHQLASLPNTKVYWPFGLAHRMATVMGSAVANIYLRTLEPEAFDSAVPPQTMAFYWDSGNGFNRNESEIKPFRLNNRGRRWERFSLELVDINLRMCAVSIGLVGQLIELTGIIVKYYPGNGEKIKSHRFPGKDLDTSGLYRVRDNFFLITDDPPLFMVPGSGDGKFNGKVSVDVFFSIMTSGEPPMSDIEDNGITTSDEPFKP